MAMVALNVLSLLFVHGALPKKSTVCQVWLKFHFHLFNATFANSYVIVTHPLSKVAYHAFAMVLASFLTTL